MFKSHYSRHLVTLIALPFLFFFTATVLAAECFSPVPGLMPGERYEPQAIIATRLSNMEYQTLKRMLAGLEGEWQGEVEEVLCQGNAESPREKTNIYVMQAEAELDSGGSLRIQANLESIENRTRHDESYRLFLASDRLSASGSGNKGDVELVELSSDSVTFVQSHYLRGNIPQEIITKISHGGQEFSIVRYFYNHGWLSAISRWKFNN